MFNPKKAAPIVGVAALLCAFAVVFWKRGAAPPVPTLPVASAVPSATSTEPPASEEETSEHFPPAEPFHGTLDCKGLGPPPPANCPVPTGPLPDLVRAGNGFFMSGGGHCAFTSPLRGALLESATQAVRAATAHTWNDDPVVERVVAQNAALRLSLCTQGAASAALRREATQLIQQLALPPSELVALGTDAVPEVRAWLGDPSSWRDLRSRNRVPVHETGYGRTKSVRAMIVGDLLANLGQLVAIDTEGKAHITPFVGSLEMRRPYQGEQVTVCAASLDVGWLRCGAPAGLRTFSPETESLDPLAPVMFRTDQGRIPCRGCHLGSGKPKSEEVSAEDGRLDVQRLRASLVKDVTERLQAIRNESTN